MEYVKGDEVTDPARRKGSHVSTAIGVGDVASTKFEKSGKSSKEGRRRKGLKRRSQISSSYRKTDAFSSGGWRQKGLKGELKFHSPTERPMPSLLERNYIPAYTT